MQYDSTKLIGCLSEYCQQSYDLLCPVQEMKMSSEVFKVPVVCDPTLVCDDQVVVYQRHNYSFICIGNGSPDPRPIPLLDNQIASVNTQHCRPVLIMKGHLSCC